MSAPTIARDGIIRIGPLNITFHRTFRIPDDGNSHGLPPSLGTFPLRRVDDYANTVPAEWLAHGGVFLPMHQREALWLGFSTGAPVALKVGAGMVCAITGAPWADGLRANDEQDYLVCPGQPWLDGFKTANGVIRQFVAMPLGSGYTVEGQLSGMEEFGGLQLAAFTQRPGAARTPPIGRRPTWGHQPALGYSMASGGMLRGATCMTSHNSGISDAVLGDIGGGAMGMAAGGNMRQRIHPDRYESGTWMTTPAGRLYVHLADPDLYAHITGEAAPSSPVSRAAYASHDYTWPTSPDAYLGDVPAAQELASVSSAAELDAKHGVPAQPGDHAGAIRNGVW